MPWCWEVWAGLEDGQPPSLPIGQRGSLEAGTELTPGPFLPIFQDFLPDGSQSQLGRLIPKLQEVNRCLGDLLAAVGKVRAVS